MSATRRLAAIIDLTLLRLVQLRQHAGSHTTLPWSKPDSNSRSHPLTRRLAGRHTAQTE